MCNRINHVLTNYYLYLQQLIDAIARQDVHNTVLVLGYSNPEHINAPYSHTDTRTALHIATALGNVVLVQLLLWVRTATSLCRLNTLLLSLCCIVGSIANRDCY